MPPIAQGTCCMQLYRFMVAAYTSAVACGIYYYRSAFYYIYRVVAFTAIAIYAGHYVVRTAIYGSCRVGYIGITKSGGRGPGV